jgi:hypothetical protein
VQALAGGLVPLIQFTASKLATRQSEYKKLQLREKVIALNAFIATMTEFHEEADSHSACLQDALRERGLVLQQLAVFADQERRMSRQLLSRNAAQRLFLLYMPPHLAGWPLRWVFFTLLITALAGTVRGLLHVNYLRLRVLFPFLIVTFVLTALARLAVYYRERSEPANHSRAMRET